MVGEMPLQAQDVDRSTAALIMDLKQRGLLDETLVIWGGEFGRTNYCQGDLSKENYGRDHHPRALHDLDGGWRRKAGDRVWRDR
jgi:membrane-anchored protein YejM (alkaline phosphatase superfamily)